MDRIQSKAHRPQPAAAPVLNNNQIGNSILYTVVAIVVIVAAIVLTLYLGRGLVGAGASGAVKGKQYQAVFLTNGQVYFGKLKSVDSGYVRLSDIYYLQVQQNVQPKPQDQNNQQPQVSLAKLGDELHGPEDTMFISRDQVLFWENLKNDGKVVTAIQDYQKSGKK